MTPPENHPQPANPEPPAAAAELPAVTGKPVESQPAADLPPANAEPLEPPPDTRPARIPFYRDFTLLQLAAIVFLLDQFTKFLVQTYLPFGYSWPWQGFFRFTHTHNTGSIFGILQGWNFPLIFISFIGIFVLIMVYRSQPRPTNLLRFSLALQLGGAFGNLLDRLRLGAVTDFIDVGPWPVFNLADASIVTGLFLLGWFLLRPANRAAADPKPAAATPAADPAAPQNPPAEPPPL